MANGNLMAGATDLVIRGTGLDLAVERHFNGRSKTVGSVGNQWLLWATTRVNFVDPKGLV
ncbi:MAG TPA: DUF6531 domain-containing protein [Acidimicrobiales bacterium]|nr:DUF6531 domain-containing protein [Acidimicrobiales bacterium]